MSFRDLSLKSKVIVPFTALVVVGIIITIIVTTSKTKNIVIDEVKNITLPGFRDTVLNMITTVMITGKMMAQQ